MQHQRRGQFLHDVDEHDQQRRRHAGPRHRQVNAPHQARARLAERPPDGVEMPRDGLHAAVVGVERDRHEPRRVGRHHEPDRSGDQQAGVDPEAGLHHRVDQVVERRRRNQQADGDHPAGDGVAQSRGHRRDPGARRRAGPHAESDHRGPGHGQRGGQCRDRHRIAREIGIARRKRILPRPNGHPAEHRHRRGEAEQHRRQADGEGRPCRRPGQPRPLRRLHPGAASGRARPAPAQPLQPGEQQSEQQQAQRQLRRRRPVAKLEPRLVDSGGEGLDVEEGHRPEIRDRLHHREKRAAGDRRTRHRQGHPDEGPGRGLSERARRHHRSGGLLPERRPRQQVDVGVERNGQHRRGAAEAAHLGKPVVPRAPAGDLPQHRLNRPGMVEHEGVGVGQHVGRKGERQGQRDLQPAGGGKPVNCHEPCRRRADHRRARAHDKRQQRGGERVSRQDGSENLPPGLQIARQRRRNRGDQRRHACGRRNPGKAVKQAFGHRGDPSMGEAVQAA